MDMSKLRDNYRLLAEKLEIKEPCDAAVILGSGWSDAFNFIAFLRSTSFSEINVLAKGKPPQGHEGRVGICISNGSRVLLFKGRRHYYEGNGWEAVAFPVYAAVQAGCRVMLLTNSAGSLRPKLKPGSFMFLRDHINLMGTNPLIGSHDPFWGPRFPNQSETYDTDLQKRIIKLGKQRKMGVPSGVYAAVPGPCYETQSEASALRRIGADAVGMSTVPEAILAHAAGLKVVAVSFISNFSGVSAKMSHSDVLSIASRKLPQMSELLQMALVEVVNAVRSQKH